MNGKSASRDFGVPLRRIRFTRSWSVWLAGLMLALGMGTGRAQWLTQTNVIVPGWSAVYLYIDPSSQTNLIPSTTGLPLSFGNPIDQIWLWKYPASTAQYLSNPLSPFSGGGQWLTWALNPSNSVNSLATLVPNTAYLIHSAASTNFTWKVKGQPVAPNYSWDITGFNFIGFPTPYANPPSFQNYFAQAPAIASVAQYFAYTGGPFSILNPQQVFSPGITPVARGKAYWVSATNVNNTYFGPFKLTLPTGSGINFGATAGQQTMHLINVTTNTLTIYAQLFPSETPPSGQTNIAGAPPLLLEGALNSSNLTYAYSPIGAGLTNSWTLPPYGTPGCDIAVVIGVNRFALTNTPGSLYAGFLRFTDSLGFSDVDVPVSAVAANNAGLWVGSANISQVSSYLKSYATNASGALIQIPLYTNIVTTNVTVITNGTTPFIANSSFETATNYVNWPGSQGNNGGYISGWSFSSGGGNGVNTPQTTYPFADNGAIPNGTNVAYIQGAGTLSNNITRLVVGQSYRVSFYANARSGNNANSIATLSLNRGTTNPFTFYPPVGGQNPYYLNSQIFTATATNAPLVVTYNSYGGDNTLIVDNFTVAPVNVTLTTVTNLVGYGGYVVAGVNTNLGAVPTPYPLRLIVFNDGTNASMLQRVYYGIRQDTNLVVATTERVLDVSHLSSARRISCTSLPWTAGNTVYPFTGQLVLGGTLTTTVSDTYDDQAANPFLHTYHPDHNNLDLTKNPPVELPRGSQSFDLSRNISLTVVPNTLDFISLTTGNSSLAGTYQETTTLTGLAGATRTFTSAGTFTLKRISPIATLTTQ